MTVIFLVLMLVILPAVIGYCLHAEYQAEGLDACTADLFRNFAGVIKRAKFHPGDYLIYRKSKVSSHPGPRARNVMASEKGEDYFYEVDKFWALSDIATDGRLVAVTRTGKQVLLEPEDHRLRKPGPVERIRYRRRFPSA